MSDGPLLHLLVVLRLANAQLANLQIGQQDRLLHVILVEVEVVAALALRFHTPRWRFLHRVVLGDVPLQQRTVGLHLLPLLREEAIFQIDQGASDAAVTEDGVVPHLQPARGQCCRAPGG